MKDFTGQRLGEYQLGGKLSADSIGAVYPSYQPKTRRAVAVKILSEELGQTRGFVERFGREYEQISSLSHPNLMPVFDFGSSGPNCFYVTRLGSTLEGSQLSAEIALNILSQIASALDYLHQKNVIHGGIRPTSVALEGETAALMDVALAKIMAENGIQPPPDPYLAPEQWKNEKITPRTDVYGLGVLAFQLLTGKLPFEGSANALMRKHLNEVPPLATSLQPTLPANVNTVLQKALEKDPAARYASAGQFMEALTSAMQEKSSAAFQSDMPDWLTSPATSTWQESTWESWEQQNEPEDDVYSRSPRSSAWEEPSDWDQPAADNQDINYYEWERQQQELEEAAAKAKEPDIPMPDLPDMFEEAFSAKPATGGLAGDDYVPEWFMGVEELSEEDVPDFLKGASLDDSLLNPLGQPAMPAPAIEMPDFDALDFPAEEQPQIRRLETQESGTEAVSLDDLLIGDEEEETPPAIRPLESTGQTDSLSWDDLFGDTESEEQSELTPPAPDLRSTSELTSVDAESDWLSSAPDEFALGVSAMLGNNLPATGELAPDFPTVEELEPAESELDFRAEDELEPAESDLDWLPQQETSQPAEPLDFRAEDELEPADLDWLPQQEMSQPAEPLDFRTEDELEPAESDLDWLPQGETSVPEETSIDSLFDLPTTGELEEAIPDVWSGGAAVTPEVEELNEAEWGVPTEGDEPDWLKGYDTPPAQTAAFDDDLFKVEEPQQTEAPDWFGEIDFSNVPDEPVLPIEEKVEAPAESDDFLDFESVNVDELFGGTVDTTLTTQEDLSLSSLMEEDDFLKDFPTAPPEEADEPELPFELPPAEQEEIYPVQTEALPEWMKRAAKTTSEEEVVLRIGGADVRFNQIPYLLLPDEFRHLREEMLALLKQGNGIGELARSGPLAGVEGALPVDNLVSTPGEITLGRMAQLTETQQKRMESLKRVLEGVQEETATQRAGIGYGLEKDDVEEAAVKAPRRRVRPKYDRLVITLLLLVLVLAPFVTDALHFADNPPAELDENAAPLALAVDGLGQQRNPLPVLVAFEYGPTAAGELDPLANAVLRDILANGGYPIIVSTNPIGLLHAEQIFRDLGEDDVLQQNLGRDLKAREDYLILRLLTGGAVGVRQLARSESFATTLFAQDINGEDTELDIEHPDKNSFAFLVLLGEHDEDVRLWAEQFETNLPKFALVTSAAEPMTRPYVSAENYAGMVAGVRGTLMYDAARNTGRKEILDSDTSLPDPDLSRWHSAILGVSVAVVIIAGGAFINLIRGMRRRRL